MTHLTLRPPVMADTELLLAWRNDPETRRNSRNGDPVSPSQHRRWLEARLASPACCLRIAEAGAEPVGVVRADRTDRGWELSWTVAPQARGRGYGGLMLRSLADGLEGLLTAEIARDNLASKKVAASAGFRLVGIAATPGFEAWERS